MCDVPTLCYQLIGEGIVVHRFFEVDGIEDFQLVLESQEHLTALGNDAALRVLSIRIEKKVNYFYEVTTSD